MANHIFVELDKSRKWLDKRREIDGYSVDGFTVDYPFRGKSVETTFFKYIGLQEDNSLPYIKVVQKLKRMQFVDGKVIISISGQKYCIGTYREEL